MDGERAGRAISAVLPPLSDRNSAGFSTANPQDFSAFSACLAHVLHRRRTRIFHPVLRSFFAAFSRRDRSEKWRKCGVTGRPAEKGRIGLRGRGVATFSAWCTFAVARGTGASEVAGRAGAAELTAAADRFRGRICCNLRYERGRPDETQRFFIRALNRRDDEARCLSAQHA